MAPDTSRAMADTAQLATITTDTGALAPGHRDFAHYSSVDMCDIAARREIYMERQSVAARVLTDTVSRTQDTLPARVAQVARACSARFSLATIAPQDLPTLFDLALLGGQDSLAHAVLRRIIAGFTEPKDKYDNLIGAIAAYLDAEPARLATAEAIAAQIDSQDSKDYARRMHAHYMIMDWGLGGKPWGNRSGFRSGTKFQDSLTTRNEAEEIIRLGHETPPEQFWLEVEGQGPKTISHGMQNDEGMKHDFRAQVVKPVTWYVNLAYDELEKLALHEATGDSAGMLAVARRAKEDFKRFMVHGVFEYPIWLSVTGAPKQMTASTPIDSVVFGLYWTAYNALYQPEKTGRPFPRLRADFWFPVTKGDSLQPGGGRLTFYKNVNLGTGTQDYDNVGQGGYALEADVRKLIEEGIKVTLVWADRGLNVFNQKVTVAAAAESARWYYQDYLHLPVDVAVRVVPLGTLPEPDGRVFFLRDKLCELGSIAACDSQDVVRGPVVASPDGYLLNTSVEDWLRFHSQSPSAVPSLPSAVQR
ncbi:MAG TPA: hypothetical protein VNU46_06385 [Gemmatimonadaceae bacterium]|nr:hypothetical protein [Gemmatimonadaceae bacterium]